MTAQEIREIAIDSSRAYYDFLDKNDKGVQEVDVFEIDKLPSKNTIYKLRLSAKLFDTEAIFFKNLRNNKKYDSTDIKIIEYDADKNILLIKISEDIKSDFAGIDKKDIKVVSDLKFLIERVRIWYEQNGSKLKLPKAISKYSKEVENIEFFKEKNFIPSENQKISLNNIFTKSFSYVWGAPGTGKTQFVLSYAVLHYIQKGDKIAILAATNNAIEQVLRGVISMTDKAGVERKQIIRLGTPSKVFAEEYPDVCEEKGIQKKITELDKQIDILERMLVFEKQKDAIDDINYISSGFAELVYIWDKINKKQDLVSEFEAQLKKKEIEIQLLSESISKKNKQLQKTIIKTNSTYHKILKLFNSKKTNAEKTISDLEETLFNYKKDIEYLKFEFSRINNDKASKENTLNEIKELAAEKTNDLLVQTNDLPELNKVISALSSDNIHDRKNEFNLTIEKKKAELELDLHLFNEYKNHGVLDIKSELENYIAMRTKLSGQSTEARLKTVNVIACTLDGYISRFCETKLNVEHIFLDEAGYANIIKALTLFNHSCPISFLGDHKQLPPVCEINDSDIQNDNTFHNIFLWAQSSIFLDTLFSTSKDICRNQYLQNNEFNPISISKTSLNTTYRFGNNLAKILSKYVYSSDFVSNNPEGQTNILFVDAKKTEGLKSRISNGEALEIEKIVSYLKQNGNNDFVILTPYRKQIRLLNRYLPQERNELKILTVHGSQGREWDTVIFSVVDTLDKWFVDTTIPVSKGLNLVNTAVSRAKRNLVLVCDKDYWACQNGQLISELVNSAEELKF